MAGVMSASLPTVAYYDIQDRPEFIEIQPNQSAFSIPLVGANLTSQAKFGSHAYLEEKKVATKRFQIPHTLIRNPGWTSDYYVPAAKLILVDRTPYNRDWVDAADRGTSKKKEGFIGQSKEGINVGTGITIAAMVKEEDAALFLYHYGTRNPVINPNDPASNFQSVSHGKSLEEIMDTVVRGYVGRSLTREWVKYSFEDVNGHARDIIDAVEKDVKEHFLAHGITIDYVGYSGALDYTSAVQKSIDDVFIAVQKAKEITAMMPTVPYMQAQAELNFRNAQSISMQKWNGVIPMPNWIIGTEWMEKAWSYVVGSVAPVAQPVQLRPPVAQK